MGPVSRNVEPLYVVTGNSAKGLFLEEMKLILDMKKREWLTM